MVFINRVFKSRFEVILNGENTHFGKMMSSVYYDVMQRFITYVYQTGHAISAFHWKYEWSFYKSEYKVQEHQNTRGVISDKWKMLMRKISCYDQNIFTATTRDMNQASAKLSPILFISYVNYAKLWKKMMVTNIKAICLISVVQYNTIRHRMHWPQHFTQTMNWWFSNSSDSHTNFGEKSMCLEQMFKTCLCYIILRSSLFRCPYISRKPFKRWSIVRQFTKNRLKPYVLSNNTN